jgi:hypothetical protein
MDGLLLWKQCSQQSVSEVGEKVQEAVVTGIGVPLLVGQTEEKAKHSVVAHLPVETFRGTETETPEPGQFGSRV